jgi:hypothetical protein
VAVNPFASDHRPVGVLLVGLLVSAQPPEHADPAEIARELDLHWQVPPTCPGESQLRRLVEDALFEEADTTRKTGLRVAARIATTVNGYELVLELREGQVVENTEIEADSCEILAEFVALKVALALNPASGFGTAAITEDPPPAAAPAPLEPAPPEPAPLSEPTPTPPSAFLQTLGGVGRGILPTVDVGPALAIGLQGAHWRTFVGAYVLFSPHARLPELDTAGVQFVHPGGELTACYQLRDARVAAPICAGIHAGAVRARGFGLDINSTVWRPHLGAAAEVSLVWPADARVRFAARLATQMTLLAPRFHVTGAGPIHQSSPISSRLSVGIEVALGGRGDRTEIPSARH